MAKTTLLQDLPDQDKMKLALDFLRENPDEKPSTAARLYHIKKGDSVRKAWLRSRNQKKPWGGHNKILRPDQHQALIRYAVDQATNGGKGDVALFTTPEPNYFWRGQLGPPLCKFANRKNTAEHALCYTASQA
jgi:hypothetical protein